MKWSARICSLSPECWCQSKCVCVCVCTYVITSHTLIPPEGHYVLSKLKICNRNTFSSQQAPLANDHYGQTGRCEKLVFLSPAARTFIFRTLPSRHALYMRLMRVAHFLSGSCRGSRKQFYIPISSELIDPECNKTMCPWCRASRFSSRA